MLGGGRCLTLTTRSPCQFPFTFNGTLYNSCTTAGHPIGRAWCYTQVRSQQTPTQRFQIGESEKDWSDFNFKAQNVPVYCLYEFLQLITERKIDSFHANSASNRTILRISDLSSSPLSSISLPDLTMFQEEEAEWDFCDVGCPVEAGCPNGWKELQSGCYQVNHRDTFILCIHIKV